MLKRILFLVSNAQKWFEKVEFISRGGAEGAKPNPRRVQTAPFLVSLRLHVSFSNGFTDRIQTRCAPREVCYRAASEVSGRGRYFLLSRTRLWAAPGAFTGRGHAVESEREPERLAGLDDEEPGAVLPGSFPCRARRHGG